jgi:cyclopropane fatty-acyl-phospholipid synthase-like methyltransferase
LFASQNKYKEPKILAGIQDPHHDEWRNHEHALAYLARADTLPHRTEGEKVLLEQLPVGIQRVLDLGTGNGRLLALVLAAKPEAYGVALDFSEPMLAEAKKRFTNDPNVQIVHHDLDRTLPQELGKFDAVVSSLVIHHLTHERKRQLFQEVFSLLNSGGVFCNLDRVASATENLHLKYVTAVGRTL